ncbi:WAP-type 'four-disulfide core' domain [Trinorchestia longiramus]|nr:WAP-type 'four-disulfide core' domain [Trinorchestia longiramus]
MIFPFAAALLVALLSSGACDAKAIQASGTPPGCPVFPDSMVTICSIGPNWCATTEDCSDGKICCPWGCGGECKDPVHPETPDQTSEEPHSCHS